MAHFARTDTSALTASLEDIADASASTPLQASKSCATTFSIRACQAFGLLVARWARAASNARRSLNDQQKDRDRGEYAEAAENDISGEILSKDAPL
jgi:hypothetical protein